MYSNAFLNIFTRVANIIKVMRKAKVRNPHNQGTPYGESNENARKRHTKESQEVNSFPAGDHKAARNRQDSITKTNTNHK